MDNFPCTIFIILQSFIYLFFVIYSMNTITIPKREYEKLKKDAELNSDLIRQFASSLNDLKKGKIKRVA